MIYMYNVAHSHSNPQSKHTPFDFNSQGDPQRKSNYVISNEVHYGSNILTSWSPQHTTYHNLQIKCKIHVYQRVGPMFICNSYITGASTEAWGLRSINAMHPECAWYNYFISHGHNYHGNNKEKEETSLSGLKPSYKAALWVQLSNIDINRSSDRLVTEGCGQSFKSMPLSLTRWCDKHTEFRIWERRSSWCLSAARAVAYPTRVQRKTT